MDRGEFIKKFGTVTDLNTPEKMIDVMKENLEHCLSHTGSYDAIKIISMEECNELSIEISKALRGQISIIGLIEEMADVLISIRELRLIYEIDDTIIMDAMCVKLDRMRERNKKEGD